MDALFSAHQTAVIDEGCEIGKGTRIWHFSLPLAGLAQKTADQNAAKPAAEESFEPFSGQPGKDVVWVPTPPEVVEAMLEMAQVKAGDKLVDLGSGDGRIAIAAAKRGAQAMAWTGAFPAGRLPS